MPKHTKPQCLPDALEQLAQVDKIADFRFSPDMGSLPACERETALLLQKAVDNIRAVAENERVVGEDTETAALIRQANEQAQLMLDAAPLAITMWDKDFRVVDCSQTALDVFGFTSKQDLIEHFVETAPEFQPCGRRSLEILAEAATEAFQNGICRLEWTGLTRDGEPIVFEDTAVRVKYRNEYALMLYSRDIREEKRTLAELKSRDEALVEQAETIRQAHEQIQTMLDALPVSITIWGGAVNHVLDCSQYAVDLFGYTDKQDLLARLAGHMPEYQPNGERSAEIIAKTSVEAYSTGFSRVEWTQLTTRGEPILLDAKIIRIKYRGDYALMLFSRDIRREKKMMADLDAANEAKSRFLAQMSHEMRTPLSAVISLSELVLENGGLSQDNEVYLDKIYNAGSTLLCIVNDILDISKIEAGKFDILPQEYDVPNMINETVAQNILRIHSKPVRFVLNVDEHMPMRLRGDDIRVKQIVSNLLSNAFKYTNEGSVELGVDFERDGDSVWTTFRISDTGVGIKPEDFDRLFTDYSRFDGDVNRKVGGTGLGLSITKRLAELMDGAVTATSEHGKGSVFTVRIRQGYVSDAVIGCEMAEHLRHFLYTTSKRRSGAQLNRVSIPYARVLVVDDNRTNLDIAKGLMRPYGMDIDCVTDGQSAIDILREGKDLYAAIFMDHMMPGMDGVEAVRIIREEIGTAYTKSVPIIALTANALTGSKERFISQGFNDFVSKPIDIFRLDTVIRQWIWDDKRQRGDSHVYIERGQRRDRRQAERRTGNDRRVSDRRDAQLPVFFEVVEGVDWMNGIELFGGEEAFRHVLRSFDVNTPPLLDTVREVSADTLPQYEIVVHGLKSSSRGVCAYALGSAAESLEFAAKDGNLDYINRHNPGFLAAARKLIADIEAILYKAARADTKPQRDRPDGAELTRLRAACEDYDMDKIEAVMREIERYDYTADDGLAAWLRDNITRLNYTRVIEKITQVTAGR